LGSSAKLLRLPGQRWKQAKNAHFPCVNCAFSPVSALVGLRSLRSAVLPLGESLYIFLIGMSFQSAYEKLLRLSDRR